MTQGDERYEEEGKRGVEEEGGERENVREERVEMKEERRKEGTEKQEKLKNCT
jgi:hypothetical protein